MTSPNFSPKSLADLKEILHHIAKDKPQAAKRFVDLLKKKCYFLARTPYAGSGRDDLSPGLRAFSVGNYVIYLHPTDTGVRVERVLHGARDVNALFGTEPGLG